MTSVSEPLVLGIETSCDETGVGIVRGNTLLADAVASSVEEHARFGGVVPEVASRAHLEAMVPTIERACATAGVTLDDLDARHASGGERGCGLGGESGVFLKSGDLRAHAAHEGGGVAQPRADIEDPVAGADVERLQELAEGHGIKDHAAGAEGEIRPEIGGLAL